jgi:hypothetical protein
MRLGISWGSNRGTAGRDTGTLRTGRLAKVAGGAWGLRPRKPPLGARAQSEVVAVVPIVTRYAAGSPHRAPPCPSTRRHPRRRTVHDGNAVAEMVGSLTAALGGITLGSMKWLLLLCLCVAGCGNDAPPTVPGTGTPIPPGMGTGGTGGVGGAGGFGGEGGVGGGARGACDNDSDLEALEGVDDNVRDIARICGLPNNVSSFCAGFIFNVPLYEECITDCVKEAVDGLSPQCSACYGALERCGLELFCRTQCQFDTCSESCLNCLNLAGCIEEFEDCRGLPGDGCPDSP